MKKSIAGLSTDNEEEETIQLGVESSDREISYASSFVGMFLTSSVLAKQLGCFIGVFLEYDASDIELRYKRIMGIRVRIDVRKPLKRKKKLAFSNCPPAQSRRNVTWRSMWLVEDGGGKIPNYGNSTNKSERSNIGPWALRYKYQIQVDWQALLNRPVGRNKTLKLERLGFRRLRTNSDCKVFLKSFSRSHIDIMIDEDFDDILSDCSLINLGYYGQWFTWKNGRTQTNNIRERLDRGIANTDWWNLFQNYKMYHLTHSFSDHCPPFLNSNMDENHAQMWYFIFEIAWLLEETCKSEVVKLWVTSSGNVPNRLKIVGVGLDVWFKKIQKEISLTKKEFDKQLIKLNDAYPTDEVLGDIIVTKLALNMEDDNEELY
ncbi:hypothetical protein Gogos_010761 [Gossypium gossypioides]|uniref:Uncharacterized protein n=1 Tax=Gossypium gossypioides TaxID=34282 RepID=A0A7J9BM84_GOSGO|nr:hypothetical protein [Gossypium gossypioides]